jgi:NAD(P)-dependent dehydrogenase (short-subunit alcohol dehydrogenase family)
MELNGTVVMITGAGRGIGRAIALAYARAGADLAVASLEAQEMADLEREVAGVGRRIVARAADVSQESAVARFLDAATAEFGQIDVLVNNAGTILLPQDVREMSVEAWDRMMAVNVRSVFLCARAVLPGMIERRRGRIINIASTAGLRGLADRAAYCASKHAVVGFTRALALDAKPYGIAVNAICPGAVDTALTAYARPDADKTGWMQPDDVAGVALFLATAAALAITGAVIEVAGWSG